MRHQSTPNLVTRHAQREMAGQMSTIARNTIPWTKSLAQGAPRALLGHGLLLLLLRPATRKSQNFPLARAQTPMNRVRAPIRLRQERQTHEQCAIRLEPKLGSKLTTVEHNTPRTGRSRDTGVQRSAERAVHQQTSLARKARSSVPLPAQSLCQATRQAMVTAATAMTMSRRSTIHQRTRPRRPGVS